MKAIDKVIKGLTEKILSGELILAREVDGATESFHTVLKSNTGKVFFKRVEANEEVSDDVTLSFIPANRWNLYCKSNVMLENIKKVPGAKLRFKEE